MVTLSFELSPIYTGSGTTSQIEEDNCLLGVMYVDAPKPMDQTILRMPREVSIPGFRNRQQDPPPASSVSSFIVLPKYAWFVTTAHEQRDFGVS